MSKQVSTFIAFVISASVAWFLVSYFVFNNDWGIGEALYRTGVFAVLFAVAMGIYTYVTAKRKKEK